MSVATEITRIQGAKADLKTSIEAKGVTVPSATLISGYASLVDQIQTSGGFPDSDGLVDIEITTSGPQLGDTFTLEYVPTYVMKYTPASAIDTVAGFTISSQSVTYRTPIVWTCDNANITINGSTVSVPGGFNSNVTFTATWVDYEGETHTTSKTIQVVGNLYSVIMVSEAVEPSTSGGGGYFVVPASMPGAVYPTNLTYNPTQTINPSSNYNGSFITYVNRGTIITGASWDPPGTAFAILGSGTTPAFFKTLAEAQFAWDNRST